MMTVSSTEEIVAQFADTHDELPAIIGKPSNNYVQRLLQQNFQALQDIDLGDGTDATVLIFSEVDHKAANENQVFKHANESLEAYNPSIQDNDNNATRLHQGKNWYRKLDHQVAIQTAKRFGKKFILSRAK